MNFVELGLKVFENSGVEATFVIVALVTGTVEAIATYRFARQTWSGMLADETRPSASNAAGGARN